MTTKANAVHLTLGNPRTVCGRRLDETNRLTKLLAEVTCSQCERHAPESMKERAQVFPPNADKGHVTSTEIIP